MIYKAWVPNVTGRLSFSHIGPTTSKRNGHGSTVTHANGVDTLCIDQRNSSDTTKVFSRYGQKILDKLRGKQGEYVFVAVGRSDADFECLSGHVFKYTLTNWENNIENTELLAALYPPDDASGIAAYREGIQNSADSLKSLCGYNGNHSAKFSLARNGELTIELDENYSFEARPKDVASSMYRFFREICHRHQHHTERNDVILDCYQLTKNGEHWRREALYSMMRYIIMSKRTKNLDNYESALGVVAYAEAFHRIFLSEFQNSPLYNFSELRASLNVALTREARRVAKQPTWIAVASFFFAVVSLALLTIRSSFGIIEYVPEEMQPELSIVFQESGEWRLIAGYAEVFLQNPISTIAAVLLFCFILTFVVRRFYASKLTAWSLEFLRLFLANFRIRGVNVSFPIRLITAAGGLYLGFSILATGFATILGEPGFQLVFAHEALAAILESIRPD